MIDPTTAEKIAAVNAAGLALGKSWSSRPEEVTCPQCCDYVRCRTCGSYEPWNGDDDLPCACGSVREPWDIQGGFELPPLFAATPTAPAAP